MSVRKSDHIERRKIALMRKADTEAGATHNIGGPRKRGLRAKPSLPKMPWDNLASEVAETRAGSAGLSPPEVFPDPAPSSVEER